MTAHALKTQTTGPLAMLMMLALLTAGCTTVDLRSHVANTPSEALAQASGESDTLAAQKYLLRMVDRFQSRGDHESARKLLRSDLLAPPANELKNQYLLLAMASTVALDDGPWARELAGKLPPAHFLDYQPDLMGRAASLQAETQRLAGDPLAAALTLMVLAQNDPEADTQALHDRIWENLKQTPQQQLQTQLDISIGYEIQGWLELASRIRQPGITLETQGRTVRSWQNDWPAHPAAMILPAELGLIASLAESQPERLVLALPLSGPLASAGRTIRDGFLAAFYQDSADTLPENIDIKIIDTAERPFQEIYDELSNEDRELVIGPLEKDALATLADMHTLPVPVLGLNYLPATQAPPQGLYQFGLSTEDEVRQIADRLSTLQLDQSLVLIPEGDWGDRIEAALMAQLRENDGTALDTERYFPEDNLRAVTADLLGISASRERAIAVERTAGIDVEFEPRRRQDADAIIMVAQPEIARQFNPLFAFYFGGDLPVYAPSVIYEGDPDPSRDRDLNGVNFTDIPWVLEPENPFRDTAEEAFPGISGRHNRLFAMGVDAWSLVKRLPFLTGVEGASIDGHTGTLTMAKDGSIHRQQLWARFAEGTPELLPPLPDTIETLDIPE